MKEITYEEYLQNSGTRGSQPISTYEERKAKITTHKFVLQPNGLYKKIIERKYLEE